MRKTIKYNENGDTFAIDASLSWLIIFRNEFGFDAVEIIAPALQSLNTFLANLSEDYVKTEKEKEIDILTEILYEFGTYNLLLIIWALAKNADETIPEVNAWYREKETFDLQSVAEDVLETILESTATTKKAQALMTLYRAKMQMKITA